MLDPSHRRKITDVPAADLRLTPGRATPRV